MGFNNSINPISPTNPINPHRRLSCIGKKKKSACRERTLNSCSLNGCSQPCIVSPPMSLFTERNSRRWRLILTVSDLFLNCGLCPLPPRMICGKTTRTAFLPSLYAMLSGSMPLPAQPARQRLSAIPKTTSKTGHRSLPGS